MTDKAKAWEPRRRWCQNYDSDSLLHQVKLISFDWTWISAEIFWCFQGARRIVRCNEEWKRLACDVMKLITQLSMKHLKSQFGCYASLRASIWVQSFCVSNKIDSEDRESVTTQAGEFTYFFNLFYLFDVDLHNKRNEKFLFLFS